MSVQDKSQQKIKTGKKTWPGVGPHAFLYNENCVNLLSSVKWVGCSGAPPSSHILWKMAIDPLGAGLWAQVPLKDTGTSCQPDGVCFWEFAQKRAQTASLMGLLVFGSATRSMLFYSSVLLSPCNSLSPGTSTTVLMLHWDAQQTIFRVQLWTCHRIWSGLPVLPKLNCAVSCFQ